MRKVLITFILITLCVLAIPSPKEDYTEVKEEFFEVLDAKEPAAANQDIEVLEPNPYPDIAGWLIISSLGIDLPVMWTPDDYDKYLRMDLEGNYAAHGELFFNAENDLNDKHLIIYGHKMRDGSYFGNLKKYLDKDFFEQNSEIILSDETYEIIAVVLDEVHEVESNEFKYYYYLGNKHDDRFIEWLNEKSVYSRHLDEVDENSEIIQLITCSYHTQDGRLIIVAVK